MRVQALRADQQTISKRSPCRRSGEGNSLRVHTRAASESGSNRSQSTTIPAAATSIVPDSEQSPDGAPTTRQQQQQEPGIFQEKEHAHCVGLKTASPLVLEFDAPDGAKLYVGCDGPLRADKPGNGGMRLWSYESEQEAIDECIGLSKGMTLKHEVFNTGFNGGKLVVNAPDPNAVDKQKLMDATADALNHLNGTIYTGQDLNTTEEDMEYLQQQAPYVLAGLYSSIDTNVATGHGVFGSLQGVADQLNPTGEGVIGMTFLVHGCGKVGGTVARQLALHGARVLTYDVFPDAAEIPQCENVSHLRWQDIECDVFVPCSISGLIDESAAQNLQCQCVCGASNLPFAVDVAQATAAERGIIFVPESITSAGAVIVDSIEAFDRKSFFESRPHEIYSFVRSMTREKTRLILQHAQRNPSLIQQAIETVGQESALDTPAGLKFQPWKQSNTEVVDYLIIGGGIAGSLAADQLQREEPGTTCCVMQQRSQLVSNELPAHDLLYRKGVSAQQAVDTEDSAQCEYLWESLEQRTGQQLREATGIVFFGPKDSVEIEARNCEQAGAPYVHYSRESAEQRLHMHLHDGWEAIEESDAGRVDGERVQQAVRSLAESSGIRTYEQEFCVDLVPHQNGSVSVITSHGRLLRADKRVICACGPHTNDLLQNVGKQLDLRSRTIEYCTIDISGLETAGPNASSNGASVAPQWTCVTDGNDEFFGFTPKDENLNKITVGLQAASETDIRKTSLRHLKSHEPDEQLQAKLAHFMQQRFGTEQPLHVLHASSNVHTVTPDGIPVLGELPGLDSIVVFAGGWKVSFDQAPLIGKWLADAAMSKPATNGRAALSLSRTPSLTYTCTAWTPTN